MEKTKDSCANCLCAEIGAYSVAFPNQPRDELRRLAMQSCQSAGKREDHPCHGMPARNMWRYMTDKFVDDCKHLGDLPK